MYNGGTLNLYNSILAKGTGTGGNCATNYRPTDNGYNLSDDATCANFSGTSKTVTTAQLNLGLLQNNGGPTKTILPGQNSVAIDAIPNSTNGCGTTVTTDQRGYARPQGNGCDVGAVEAQFSSEYLNPTSGNNQQADENTQYASPLSVTITDTSTGAGVSGAQVIFTAPSSSSSITFTNGSNVFTSTTNSSGIAASSVFTANNQPGYVTVTVSVNYATLNPHTVTPHDITGPVYFTLINTYPNGLNVLSVNNPNLVFNSNTPQTQSLKLLATAATTTWSSNISYSVGANNWLTLATTSGTLLAGNSQNIEVSANSKSLQPGTYTASLTFSEVNNSTNSVTVQVSLTVGNAAGSYTYYLPFVSNAANDYTSQLTLQNMGNGPATISAQYFDSNGQAVGQTSLAGTATCSTLAQNAACVAPNPFASGAKGTGVLVSSQALSVLVQEATPFGSSAYAVSAWASASLVAPLAINNSGGFNTQLTIANVGASATTATVSFYDQSGNQVAGATKTLNLAAHAVTKLDQTAADSGLAAGFYGWAKIDGAAGASLVAQVLETRADIKFVALANAQVASATKVYAPAIFNNAFGGFSTGMNIVNPNANPTSVTITYYDNTGRAYSAAPLNLPAHGVAPVYQGGNNAGLPTNFYGSATISSSAGNIVVVVNEAGNKTASGRPKAAPMRRQPLELTG